MGASSVTGVSGHGDSGKATLNDLSRWANGPTILMAGIATAGPLEVSSPPTEGVEGTGTVVFPTPFPGLGEEHCVILTTLNGGVAYVIDMDDQDLDGDDEDDHFTGFTFLTQYECDVMFIVTKVGCKAQ